MHHNLLGLLDPQLVAGNDEYSFSNDKATAAKGQCQVLSFEFWVPSFEKKDAEGEGGA
jgi:hypothetical protein